MLEPGETIDIWVVEKALGAGGMGSVYRCHNRRAKRILAAVKTLDPSIRRYPGAEARFVREAEILFALDHPNIVKVRNIRVDLDPPYIEMEFIRGTRLEDHLTRGPLALEQGAALIRQLFDALGYLHRQGVRHRDVKPANLLVQEDGTLKIVDFGLAMESDATRITQGGMAFGTVSYAPPEWIRPELIDPQAWDAYSAGVVAWEILTGQTAFPSTPSGDPRQQAMQVIISKQGHAPLDPGAAVGDGLRRAVIRLTDADPSQRLTDLDEALRMLGGSPGLVPFAGAGATVPPEAPSGGDITPHTWHEEQPSPRPPDRSTPIRTTFDEHLPREFQPQSGSLDPLDLDIKTSARPMRSFAALGLAVLTTASLGLSAAYLWTRTPNSEPPRQPPTSRSLAVSVAGLPAEISYTVGIDGVPAPQYDGGLSRFPEVPLGDQAIYLIIGDQCDPMACPGDTCPSWCGVTEHPLTVHEGAGEQAVSLVGTPPKARPVTVSVADDVGIVTRPPSELADGRATPGKYEVLAYAGECPEDPWTCLTEECGDCRTSTLDWIVPATAEVQPLVIPLRPEVPQEPAPVPRRRSSLVTHGDFASWLSTHPEWQREAAIARNQADAGYLKGWSGTTPPVGMAGKPVVDVSWYAADAFCFGRGGLADVEAPPLTWTAGPMIELRQSGGGVAWRSSDGTPSTQLNRNQTNSFAGVRCRR